MRLYHPHTGSWVLSPNQGNSVDIVPSNQVVRASIDIECLYCMYYCVFRLFVARRTTIRTRLA